MTHQATDPKSRGTIHLSSRNKSDEARVRSEGAEEEPVCAVTLRRARTNDRRVGKGSHGERIEGGGGGQREAGG